MKIGVVGCGAIGSVLCRFIDGELNDSELVGVCDIIREKAVKLAESLRSNPDVTDIDSLIKKAELVVEAASPSIVGALMEKCIRSKKHLMVMSVGGIIENIGLLDRLTARLFIPSGAICGIDGIKAANIEKLDSVVITSTKNPRGFEGAPYILKKGIKLDGLRKKTKLFEGNALEAIKGFPQNVNVAATLSLAGIGAEKTIVRVFADPKIRRNIHEIEAVGPFGRIYTKTENVVSPLNPKTSHLAVLSACATLKRLTGNVKIGS